MGNNYKAKIYKWKIEPLPTGRYRSFQKRGWPSAYYNNGEIAAQIRCEVGYDISRVKSGNHPPLTLSIADHSKKPSFVWLKVKGTFATIELAKIAFDDLIEKYPHIISKQESHDQTVS